MNPCSPWPCTVYLLTTLLVPAALASEAPAPPLTLERAVSVALGSADPAVERLEARARALEDSAVADAQLPDPMLTSQLMNVPTDTFALDQAEMTQLRIGLRQELPPGRTLAVRASQRHSQAEAERARKQLQLREIALATRQAWYELAFQQRALDIVDTSHNSVRQQIDSLSARFATGRINAQELLRAELELSLLEDRRAEHKRQAEVARATLARYVGAAEAQAGLPAEWPALSLATARPDLVERLFEHPAVAVENAEIEAADAGVDLAAQAYKPALALEGAYGVRQDRPDFASVGVTVSLPLFTNKRQDARHRAAVRQRGAEQLDRDAVLLELRRQLDAAWSDWQRYQERLELYHKAVLQHARRTADASITTYANGQTDFAELIRSQLAELDTALRQAELEAQAGQAWARIVYLTGEPT